MGKRLRDPVHGLIVFDDGAIDTLAWSLIDTPEFQRLRRIRQLGVSEFTFPGAVHTRFAHSIGVFHIARQLVEIVRREMTGHQPDFDEPKSEIALIAALLHDLGHGPFSHTFEGVQKSRGAKKRHEQWTADIIRNPGGQVFPLLEAHRAGFAEAVASLLEKEDPEDIYHAIVSSSFDADRLDYLRRDKLMTGTGAGGIDFDWLLDNIRVAEIEIDAPDEDGGEPRKVPTFCIAYKALQAAEQFLLARYTLSLQVYYHKATRSVEKMIGKLLRRVAALAAGTDDQHRQTGLAADHPLLRFFGTADPSVEHYLALDDSLIFGALDAMSKAEDPVIADIADRLRFRKIYKTLDLAAFGEDKGEQRSKLRRIKRTYDDQITAETVLIDDMIEFGIYSEIGGDDAKMHKKLHILCDGEPMEIIRLSPMLKQLELEKKIFTRVYFADPADRDAART